MNEEERFLIKRARENLKAAQLLAQQGFPEIAASRAYFTMFYIAEALLLRRGLAFSSHSAVIAGYGKEYAKMGILDPKFHQYLIKSQGLRHMGDYGMEPKIVIEDIQESIVRAEEFLEAAESYLNQGD